MFLFHRLRKESKPVSKPGRPPLPERPAISSPVSVTGTRTEREAIAVKRDIVKPTRPPPPPTDSTSPEKKPNKPPLPPRPKGRDEVVKWWKETEHGKSSGLDVNKSPYEWFHGMCFSLFSSFLLLYYDTLGTIHVVSTDRLISYDYSGDMSSVMFYICSLESEKNF